jgi:hypothetical protein
MIAGYMVVGVEEILANLSSWTLVYLYPVSSWAGDYMECCPYKAMEIERHGVYLDQLLKVMRTAHNPHFIYSLPSSRHLLSQSFH